MADNFNDPFAQNLVGLWDFLNGSENNDTGLADGFAQNGHTQGGASVSGNQLHTDGHNDLFDVSGNDDPFDLDVGTIAVQFTQDSHIGSSPDVVVNRGEFRDMNTEGWFGIKVTQDGKVIVQHCPIGPAGTRIDAFIDTPEHFFSPGDEIKVTYAWDASTGSTAIIQNLSTGAVFEETSNVVGLTMDIGDNDDENFTFGAREVDDGSYDEFFNGSIDYVAIYDVDTINTVPPAVLDGIVEGDNDANVIDAGYEGDPDGDKVDNSDAILPGEAPQDDIIDALGGNDTIEAGAGNDDVYAGSGDDSVDGGAGDDLIYGDSNLPGGGTGGGSPTTLDIDDLSGGALTSADGSVSATVVQNGFSVKPAGFLGATSDVFYAERIGENEQAVLSFDFDGSVQDVSFTLFDVNDGVNGSFGDWDDQVTIIALDENGIQVPVSFSGGDVNVNGNTIEGESASSTALLNNTNADNVQVSVQGPFSSLQIVYENGPDDSVTGYIGVGDLNVTPVVGDTGDTGADGDDVIDGGDGNDTIFGEGGDDSIDGGAGDDVIYGDSAEDTSGTPATRELFEWDEAPGFGNNATASDFTQDTGNANITFSIVNASGGVTNTYETEFQYTAGLDAAVNENGSFESILNGDVNSATYGWSSDTPVENVEFRINDIDGDGRVVVRAYDENGNPIEVILSNAGSDLALSNADGVAGNETATSIDGDYADDHDPAHSVLVTIPGPVSSWEVLHEQDGTLNSGINFTDIAFDVPGTPDTNGEGGNDTIIGGEGADQMFGEGGDDTFIVSSADEGNGDVIVGGNGPDQATDNDVLDLRGAGVVTINEAADANDEGATSGTVTFADGSILTFEGIETILTDPQNQGPTANDDTITVDEDDSVTFDPTANDTDPDGDPITVDTFTQPDNGTVTENPDGTLTYTPDPDYNGPDSFTVTVTDPGGETSTSTVTVNVTPVNDGPDAVNDSDTTDEDTAVTVDLLANDTDVEGDALTVTGATVPADQGTLVDNGDGTVTFTPAPDFNGTATISYSITDGNGGTDTAIHEIEVTPVNDDPVAVDDQAETLEDEPVVIDLVGNDTDVDGDPLTIGTVSVPADQGTVVDNGDGTVTFTPAPDYNGPAEITYTVVDGQGGEDEGTAIVNVGSVNDGPDAVDDADTTDEDTAITVNLLANDTDPEGDALTVTGATVPADQGTLVDNGDGTVTFTPAPDFNGEATISYSITDGNGGTDAAEHVITVTPVNDDPVAVDDLETTDEDTPVTIDLVGNDTDVDGDPLTIGTVSVPADQGTVVDNGDGTVTFTPAPDFNGPATITYTVVDGQGGEDEGQAVVSVGAVNDGPVAVDDEATTDEDTSVVVDLVGNDTDADGDDLTLISVSVPADQGTVVDNGDGTVTFTPAPDFNGEATISYEISDGNGGTDTGEAVVDVTPVNDGPDAVNDSDTTDEDTAVTVDLLANDTDVEGDALTVTGATVPADQGTLVDNGDGTVTFTPAPDFNGTATISYSITDGNGGTDTAIHEIEVTPVNDDPVAVDDQAETLEDEPVVIDLVGNDTDVDGDPLTIGTVSVPADQGTVVDNGDGTVTFTPAPDYNGPAEITYTVVDGQGGEDEGTAIVNVGSVNDGPDAVDDADTTDEDTAITVNLLANDTDPEGDALTVTGATVPADQGTLVDNGDGTVTFTPAPDFNGEATISYSITDGNGGTDAAEHVITVTPVNDDPVAVDDLETTDEDTPVTIDLVGNDTDVDGDPLTIGTVSVPADQGTVVDNGDGTVTFTPAPDFNGPATITYTVVDGQGGEDEGQAVVSVGAVNDGPVAVDDEATTDEDTSVVVDLVGNDTDADGDDLTLISVSVPADQGTVVDNGDGTVTFTPAPDFNGEATISYEISDGNGGTDTGEAVVDVTPVNDGPDAVNDSDTTDEDTAVTVDLLANDTDVEGDALTVTGATVPADQGTLVDNGDGTVTFTPAPDFNGTATISYSITDGNGGTDTAIHEIEVTPVNDDPVAVDDQAETLEDEPVVIDLVGNDTDVDGDPLTIGTVSVPADQGTVVDNGDGTVTFTPAPDYNGPAEITYTVVDGQGGEDEGTAIVNVGSVNDGPDAVDDADTTDEDTAITVNLLANDTDPEGDALTVTGATVPADQGTLVDNGDGTVTFTPAPNFNGEATISYSITDGNGGTDAAEHVITVTPVNDDPVAVDDLETTDEDTPVTIDLVGNDTDVDGDPLTIGTVSVPADQGTVVDNGDGTVTFTPAPDFNGPATITYTVVDGQGGEDEGQAVVSVGAVNDGPVANDDTDTTDEDTPITVDLIGNDTDADGDTLTVLTATVPADQGTLVDNGDGTVTFTPAPNFNGDATISYEISDGNGGTDTATHTITVTPVNDDPVAVDDADTTPFNTPVTVDVIGNDTDVDGDPLTIGTVSVPADQGTVVDNGDGTVTFTPVDGYEGPATITYTVVDGQGGEDEGELIVTVEEQPLDGIVEGTDDGELIDEDYTGDPEGDMVDNGDNIFSGDPEDEDDDIIEAGGGNDTVVAGEGDDSVDGGTGDDEITGGAGSDTIEGGTGDDVIDAGDPDNTFQIDKGYPGLFTGEEGTPEAEDDRDFVDGGDGNDTITTGDDRDTIVGGSGDDVIDGGIDDDEITGDEGADRIVGGEGSDDIEGGIGNDTIYAGNDPDLGLDNLNIEDDGSNPFGPDLRPDNGRDTVSGGEGDDVIFGADDDDLLFGDEGNDFIDGEIDDDTIDGGIGDDTLLGGQGNDSILGGDGNDSINAGRNSDFVDGGDGNDTILGENGADVLNGGDGDDLIDGGTGDDTLNGDGGNDSILGSTGDDVIDGGTGDDTIDGGNGGEDIMSGGDDRDTFINVNAGEVVDGGEGVTETEDFDTLDLTGSAPANGSLQVVYDDSNPENGVVNFFDQDGNDAGQLTFTNIENVIPCFTPGTLIATPKGERRVEHLEVGDRIITRDNGIQEIRWMGAKDMKAADFAKAQHLRPVMIRQGALGGGLPERDMMVSPNHRVLVANDKTALYFEEREVLVAAKFLIGLDGVDVVDVAWTTYIHIMFDQHEVVLSDGAWTESFQPGDQTLAGVGNAQRNEIFELFPELETRKGIDGYTSARRTLKKHEAALLAK